MKSFLFFLALFGAAILSTSSSPSVTQAANTVSKERAEMTFSHPVQLLGVTLQGKYLFVHDDNSMLRGEACTFVYEGVAEIPRKLVVSFHCTPANRNRVAYFTVRTSQTFAGQFELTEFQFAGSTETHLVRIPQHSEHVAIAPLD